MARHEFHRLTEDHLAFAASLCRQAGWNQIDDDWRIFLQLAPDGGRLVRCGDTPAGTVTTLPFFHQADPIRPAVSWISMLLVDTAQRSQGLGTALLDEAIKMLATSHCIRLDATPEGEPLYRKRGFVPEFGLLRLFLPLDNVAVGPADKLRTPEPISPESLTEASQLDALMAGAERVQLLAMLLQRGPALTLDGNAFLFTRSGSFAAQVGPIFAQTHEQAGQLLRTAIPQLQATGAAGLIIDVPAYQTEWLATLAELGFTQRRRLLRMRLGENLGQWPDPRLFAIAGPELG